MVAFAMARVAQTAAAAVCATLLVSSDPAEVVAPGEPSFPPAAQEPSVVRRLAACPAESNCVSSNYREPPNRYVSPLRIVKDPDVAFKRAVRDVQNVRDGREFDGRLSVVEIAPRDRYIHVTVPGTAPSSVDDVELLFSEGVANVRCEATVTLPPPPFCVKKNCINGNMDQRSRVERMGRLLGLPPSDREEMAGAKWTPIFMNSDRVPGFEDDF